MPTQTIEVRDLIAIPRGRKSKVQAAIEALVQAALDSDTPYDDLSDATDTLIEAMSNLRERN